MKHCSDRHLIASYIEWLEVFSDASLGIVLIYIYTLIVRVRGKKYNHNQKLDVMQVINQKLICFVVL